MKQKHFHFIAIGGAAMHNLAIALHKKGYKITGSDDEIFDPAFSNLKKYNLLPEKIGWFPEKITNEIDAIILGMHAKADNPELLKAKKLGLKIFSYPAFVYEQSKNKTRVVIGGSHGKTTTTGMIMHILNYAGIEFDYVVGAPIKGYEETVKLSENAKIIVIEGDEYLTSALDPVPKFHKYRPDLGVITGIAWDHINVFETFDKYIEQFKIFIEKFNTNATLFYFCENKELKRIVKCTRTDIKKIAYCTHPYTEKKGKTYLIDNNLKEIEIKIFGKHNMQNISAAKKVTSHLGIDDKIFYKAISTFEGSKKRLEKVFEEKEFVIYSDFAHAPSKVVSTVKAIKEKYPNKPLIAVLELHTYSSLNKKFLPNYKKTLDIADNAIVYYNKHTLQLKGLPEITTEEIKQGFEKNNLVVITDRNELIKFLKQNFTFENAVLLMMSSGNFSGIDLKKLGKVLLKPITKKIK